MRKLFVPLFLLGAIVSVVEVSAQDKKEEKATPKSELKKYQGVWQVQKFEFGGKEAPNPEKRTVTIDVDSKKWIFEFNKQNAVEDKITFDPSKDPKTIELVGAKGTRLGIYRYSEEDGLEVCLSEHNSKDRPTIFSTTLGMEGRGATYYVMKKKDKK